MTIPPMPIVATLLLGIGYLSKKRRTRVSIIATSRYTTPNLENQSALIISHIVHLHMDQSLPHFIEIRWIGTEIRANFYKTKKIEFTCPPELCGKVVQSINEAVRLVDDEDQYYYSHAQWEVLEPKGWTVWRYERRVAALNQQIQAAQEVKTAQLSKAAAGADPVPNEIVTEIDDKDEKIVPVEDPRVCNNWTSEHVAKWIFQQNSPELTLIEIKYFRRYNHGFCFEFFCVWDWKDFDGNYRQTWQKYIDLYKTPSYNHKIHEQWNWEVERFKHFEDYGPDPIDSQLVLPPLTGDAYVPDKITDIATKKMKKEEHELKKSLGSRKKRSSPIGRNKKKQKVDTDSDDEFNSGDSPSTSEENDDGHEENDTDKCDQNRDNTMVSDGDYNEVPLNLNTPDRIIFETSSVSPVPRYLVKWFKKRVVKKNK
jgi:hypothetical protein